MTKEEKREYDKQYRLLNPGKYKQNNKLWRQNNPERFKEIHKNWRKRNPEKLRSWGLKSRYGITLENRHLLLAKQNYKCAICGRKESETPEPLYVDHNHKTGEIRGLLCTKCNTGLGQFNDELKLLKNAIKYLTKGTK